MLGCKSKTADHILLDHVAVTGITSEEGAVYFRTVALSVLLTQ